MLYFVDLLVQLTHAPTIHDIKSNYSYAIAIIQPITIIQTKHDRTVRVERKKCFAVCDWRRISCCFHLIRSDRAVFSTIFVFRFILTSIFGSLHSKMISYLIGYRIDLPHLSRLTQWEFSIN